MGASKDSVHHRWLREDEEIPYMTKRLPCCAICKENGIFTTARKMNGNTPVCEKHYADIEIDPESIDLTIDDI